MLVLSRNQDSAVRIGSDVKIKVLSIKRRVVTLGIDAPKYVRVWRDELEPQPDERPAPADGQSPAKARVVLVVEDDPGHARLIRKALCQQRGTKVSVVGTAEGALDALGARATSADETLHPDLILLDLGLPDRSGLDVLRIIRLAPQLKTTPVVMLSCSDEEGIINECLESGANAFVPKSAGYDDFRMQVSRLGEFWVNDCCARRYHHPSEDERATSAPADGPSSHAEELDEPAAGTDCGKRILVADDDAGHATLIKRALRRGGIDCAVDVVHNGVEAINYLFGLGEFANRGPVAMPDLMLLDLNMPEMNGRQVLQVLRNAGGQQRWRLPPVVVLTSSEENADIDDSYSLGARSCIRKPVDHEEFATAVQQTTQYWLSLNESRIDAPFLARCRKTPR